MVSVMSWNTWGGCAPGFEAYLRKVAQEPPDVLCLQEVHHVENQHFAGQYIEAGDPGHRPGPILVKQLVLLRRYFGVTHEVYFERAMMRALHELNPLSIPVEYGVAMLVRRSMLAGYSSAIINNVLDARNVRDMQGTLCGAARAAQMVTVRDSADNLHSICHFHGSWLESCKLDHSSRTLQCKRVLSVMDRHLVQYNSRRKRVALCGDFNFTTDTEAMQILVNNQQVWERVGGVLLTPYTDTRTALYPAEKQYREADHVIVSPSVAVTTKGSLQIKREVPSDHALLHFQMGL